MHSIKADGTLKRFDTVTAEEHEFLVKLGYMRTWRQVDGPIAGVFYESDSPAVGLPTIRKLRPVFGAGVWTCDSLQSGYYERPEELLLYWAQQKRSANSIKQAEAAAVLSRYDTLQRQYDSLLSLIQAKVDKQLELDFDAISSETFDERE